MLARIGSASSAARATASCRTVACLPPAAGRRGKQASVEQAAIAQRLTELDHHAHLGIRRAVLSPGTLPDGEGDRHGIVGGRDHGWQEASQRRPPARTGDLGPRSS